MSRSPTEAAAERYRLSARETNRVLTWSCLEQGPFLLLVPGDGEFRHGRFLRLDDGFLDAALADPPAVGAACFVTFPFEGRCFGFASVASVAPDRDDTVRFEAPATLFGTEGRRALRVPIVRDFGLKASLSASRGEQRAAVLDLSTLGARILVREAAGWPHAGDRIEVALRRGPIHVALPARVLSRTEDELGILFLGPAAGERFCPPEALRRILADAMSDEWADPP